MWGRWEPPPATGGSRPTAFFVCPTPPGALARGNGLLGWGGRASAAGCPTTISLISGSMRRRSVTLSLWDDDFVEQREDRGVLFDVIVAPRGLPTSTTSHSATGRTGFSTCAAPSEPGSALPSKPFPGWSRPNPARPAVGFGTALSDARGGAPRPASSQRIPAPRRNRFIQIPFW